MLEFFLLQDSVFTKTESSLVTRLVFLSTNRSTISARLGTRSVAENQDGDLLGDLFISLQFCIRVSFDELGRIY